MTDRFLQIGTSGGNATNGTLNIFGATIGASNLQASKAVKTDTNKRLYSTNLAISDTTGLQTALDGAGHLTRVVGPPAYLHTDVSGDELHVDKIENDTAVDLEIENTGATEEVVILNNSNEIASFGANGMELGNSGATVTEVIDDDTMATAADTNIATSESIKAYVDAHPGTNNWKKTGTTLAPVNSGDDVKTNLIRNETGNTLTLNCTDSAGALYLQNAGNTKLTVFSSGVNLAGGQVVNYIDTDGTFALSSDLRLATMNAIKTYVDNHPVVNFWSRNTTPDYLYPSTLTDGVKTAYLESIDNASNLDIITISPSHKIIFKNQTHEKASIGTNGLQLGNTGATVTEIDASTSLSTDSDTKLITQHAAKTYIDNEVEWERLTSPNRIEPKIKTDRMAIQRIENEGTAELIISTNSASRKIIFGNYFAEIADIDQNGFRLGTGTRVTTVIDDDSMATAADTNIATAESIKAYVDTQITNENFLDRNVGSTPPTLFPFYSGDALAFNELRNETGSDLTIQNTTSNDINIEVLAGQIIDLRAGGSSKLIISPSNVDCDTTFKVNRIEESGAGHGVEIDGSAGQPTMIKDNQIYPNIITASYIEADASKMNYEVPSGDSHDFTVNSASVLEITGSSINTSQQIAVDQIVEKTGSHGVYIANTKITGQTLMFDNTAIRPYIQKNGNDLLHDVPSGGVHKFTVNGFGTPGMTVGTGGIVCNSLVKVDILAENSSGVGIKLEGSAGNPTLIKDNKIYPDSTLASYVTVGANGLIYESPGIGEHSFTLAGAPKAKVDGTGLRSNSIKEILPGNGVGIDESVLIDGKVYPKAGIDSYIFANSSNMQYEVATGDEHQFTVNSGELASIDGSGLQLSATGARITQFDNDDTMATDSATRGVTQAAVVGYVDGKFGSKFVSRRTSTVSNITGNTSSTYYTVVFNTEDFDPDGVYNNTTGVFTANKAGLWEFRSQVRSTGYNINHTHYEVDIYHNTTTYKLEEGDAYYKYSGLSAHAASSGSITLNLALNDTVSVRIMVYGYTTNTIDVTQGSFSGRFIEDQ